MLPRTLIEIANYLKKSPFKLSQKSADGRINSAINEDELLFFIKKQFPNILCPKKREPKDFSFEENEKYIPVNIKITNTNTTDNLNCKVGIYYALSGKIPTFDNQIDWKKYLEILQKNISENDKDYYFLVINKNNFNDIYPVSLKCIHKIIPNGNNLPFQARWDQNKIPLHRTFEEAKNYLLSTMGKSFKLRSRVYCQFIEYFPEFKSLLDE
ncbi:restriction endonuclease [Helicobacter sp. 11S03491-1]|uniref:restriction endonuclease n=1 Tax=Helicobacter sp. 11S03491-1 TaxID=1476196 RepID=UPI000BA55BF5|nr:restriction endonuclease [Helicobacter sp. 11S03491-1]PAF43423.1 restriction endonuclease [Helicobacter sp. 11S03491-1]